MLRAMDQKELWMVQAVDQGAIEAAMGAASDGSESNRLSDGCCKLWIYGCYKRLIRLKS